MLGTSTRPLVHSSARPLVRSSARPHLRTSAPPHLRTSAPPHLHSSTRLVPSPSRTLVPIPASHLTLSTLSKDFSPRGTAHLSVLHIYYIAYINTSRSRARPREGKEEARYGHGDSETKRSASRAANVENVRVSGLVQSRAFTPCSTAIGTAVTGTPRLLGRKPGGVSECTVLACLPAPSTRTQPRPRPRPRPLTRPPALARIVVRSSSQSRPPRIGRQKRTLYLKTRSPSTGIMQIGWSARAPRSTRRT